MNIEPISLTTGFLNDCRAAIGSPATSLARCPCKLARSSLCSQYRVNLRNLRLASGEKDLFIDIAVSQN